MSAPTAMAGLRVIRQEHEDERVVSARWLTAAGWLPRGVGILGAAASRASPAGNDARVPVRVHDAAPAPGPGGRGVQTPLGHLYRTRWAPAQPQRERSENNPERRQRLDPLRAQG